VLPTEEVQAVVDDAERFLEENREKIRLLTFPSSE
jgi:hypothetical protein